MSDRVNDTLLFEDLVDAFAKELGEPRPTTQEVLADETVPVRLAGLVMNRLHAHRAEATSGYGDIPAPPPRQPERDPLATGGRVTS